MDRIPYIVGPTGVGKSTIALEIAAQLRAEIVSADSRQVFTELQIGTDRPSENACRRVVHHLVGNRSIREGISAGVFARAAEAAIGEIVSRRILPIVVGGSTLYLQALAHGLAEIPAVDASIRQELNRQVAENGSESLFNRLQKVDSAFAATLDPSKSQRIVRGLEVFEGTGRPLSSFFTDAPRPAFNFDVVVLNRPRAELYDRINRRVDHMMSAGLVDEVRGLLAQGFIGDESALQTIGYREVFAFLRGEMDEMAMTEQIKTNSRRYAKRQLTWYRRMADTTWIDLSAQPAEEVIDTLVSRWV